MQAEAERFVLRPFLLPNEHSEEPRYSTSAEAPAGQLGGPGSISRKSMLARARTKSILECAPLPGSLQQPACGKGRLRFTRC